MRKPNPWPKRLAVGLVAVLMAATLWFFRDRLLPANDSQAATTASTAATSNTASEVAGSDASGLEVPSDSTPPPATTTTTPVTDAPATTSTRSNESVASVATDAVATDSTQVPAAATPPKPASAPTNVVASLPPATLVSQIAWEETDNGTLLAITLNGALEPSRLTASELGGPSPRILIKARGIEEPYASAVLQVGSTAVRRIRTGYHPSPRGNELHIVVDLASSGAHLVGEPLPGPDGRVEVLISP